MGRAGAHRGSGAAPVAPLVTGNGVNKEAPVSSVAGQAATYGQSSLCGVIALSANPHRDGVCTLVYTLIAGVAKLGETPVLTLLLTLLPHKPKRGGGTFGRKCSPKHP